MELKAETREKFGKSVSALRKAGVIPAEFYGRGIPNQHLAVALKDFNRVYKAAGENTVVTVEVGGAKHSVLIYDVKRNYLSGAPDHIDFYKVRMDEKIQTKIPLEFVGEAPGVKDKNGLLVKSMHELPVEALPGDVPHSITVDISKLLDIGNTIYVEDLVIAKAVKVLVDGRTAVATIKAKMTEEQEAALQAAGSVETVKVESEEKKAERDAAKATAAPMEGGSTSTEAKPEAKK